MSEVCGCPTDVLSSQGCPRSCTAAAGLQPPLPPSSLPVSSPWHLGRVQDVCADWHSVYSVCVALRFPQDEIWVMKKRNVLRVSSQQVPRNQSHALCVQWYLGPQALQTPSLRRGPPCSPEGTSKHRGVQSMPRGVQADAMAEGLAEGSKPAERSWRTGPWSVASLRRSHLWKRLRVLKPPSHP